MENENEEAQEDVVEPEETTEEETVEEEAEPEIQEEAEEDTVTLKKSDFTKLNRKARAYDATKKESDKKTDLSTESAKAIPADKLERMELRLEGYSKEEVDEIMELGGMKVLDSKIVQSAIKSMRAEKKSKDANQDIPAKSPVYKKYTQEDLKGMTSAELEKILPHA